MMMDQSNLHYSNKTVRRIIFILLLIPMCLKAQETQESTTRLFVGGGWANVLDTYLSPYAYKGGTVKMMIERQYEHTMHRTSLHVSGLENPAGNVNEYDFGVAYGVAHHFQLLQNGAFRVKAGPMGHFYLGCIYNERNGNNPAQAKLALMLDASALATYDFRLFRKDFQLEYSLDIPFIGFAYSPQFGQSYYEEFSLGNYDHNCVFAHPFNTPSLRQRLVIDFKFNRGRCLYLGYDNELYQTKYNELRHHSYSHSIILGIKL